MLDFTWLNKFEYAARHGGVSLSETECYQLYIYIAHLEKLKFENEKATEKAKAK